MLKNIRHKYMAYGNVIFESLIGDLMPILKIKNILGTALCSLALVACVSKNPPPAAGVYPTIDQAWQPVSPVGPLTPTKFLERNGINVVRVGDIVEIVIPADKIFLANSTNIKFSGEPFMYAIVKVIQEYGHPDMTITAYTDSIGRTPYKENLSQLWAQSVTTYLWAHGIPLQRMHFHGGGDLIDIASRRTAKGSYYNRHVEIVFWIPRQTDIRTRQHVIKEPVVVFSKPD
jgi:outer membrane protein OmpA-like peptidoglycan-associated protein